MSHWRTNPSGNVVLRKDGGFISYRKGTVYGIRMFAGDTEDETAVVVDGEYYILNGDWREKFEDLSIAECLVVFQNNPEAHSSWSSIDIEDDEAVFRLMSRIIENLTTED